MHVHGNDLFTGGGQAHILPHQEMCMAMTGNLTGCVAIPGGGLAGCLAMTGGLAGCVAMTGGSLGVWQ